MSTQTFHIINLCINQIEGTKMLSNMLPTLAPNSSVLQLCIMQKAVDALSYDAYLYAPTRIIMWAITQEICCSMVILVDWLLDIDLKLIAHSMHQICSASPPYCLLCSLRNFISDEIKTKIKAACIWCDFTIWDRCGWIGQGPSWYVWILGVRFQKGYLSPKMYQVVCKCEVCYHFRPLLSLYWSSFWTMENPHNHPSTSKDWSGPHERKMECCWSPEQNWIH